MKKTSIFRHYSSIMLIQSKESGNLAQPIRTLFGFNNQILSNTHRCSKLQSIVHSTLNHFHLTHIIVIWLFSQLMTRSRLHDISTPSFIPGLFSFLNRSSRRKRGMASNPLFIIPDFFCIFQMNLAMATLGLKEMGKFLQI